MLRRRSAVGVIDKAVAVLDLVATEPCTLAQLVAGTGLTRPTAHRLATALEAHGLLRRDDRGRYVLGWHLAALGRAASPAGSLAELALPVLAELRDETGESVQLYVRDGDERVCVASLDSPDELRTVVDVGARLPLDRGSAGVALTAVADGSWVESVAERAAGVASVSAAVVTADGTVVAALGVSGPVERTTTRPGSRYGAAVEAAAADLAARLG